MSRSWCVVAALAALASPLAGCGKDRASSGGPQIDPMSFKEIILAPDGTIDQDRWEYAARHYHEREILDWRLGPSYDDLNPDANEEIPALYQPDPHGLWKGGLDPDLADKFCVTSDQLPKSEAEEKALYDGGGGWIMSGQMLFSPDPKAPAELSAGSANLRGFDGAMARKDLPDGTQETRALCMRINASWTADWWNRNNISAPETPSVTRLKAMDPKLPLPPVGTARGGIQASVTGFLAFQSGWIMAAGTGNDPYDGIDTVAPPQVELPDGMVPTAIAQTPMNEFVLVTVWNLNEHKGQLAVLASGVEGQPANIQDTVAGRVPWGVMSWPTVTGLKYLGVIDLPMQAPMAVSVTTSAQPGNMRGYDQWKNDDLNQQAVRDAWYGRPWTTNDDTDGLKFRQLASAGYAVVSSRAENKVSFVDLRPLLAYYRQMYLTTQERWDETANGNQGDGDDQWPYRFSHAPEQRPVVVATLDVPRPTAVHANKRAGGTNTRGYFEHAHDPGSDAETQNNQAYRAAVVASLDGSVRYYDVESLGDPTMTPATPALIRTVKIGANPTSIDQPLRGDGAQDDLAITARAARAVHVLTYKGDSLGVVRDPRIKDPVRAVFGVDGAGYGGSGPDYAVNARVLDILDYRGKTIHAIGMFIEVDPERPFLEQWRYVDADGDPAVFNYGSGTALPGQPFDFTLDEVI